MTPTLPGLRRFVYLSICIYCITNFFALRSVQESDSSIDSDASVTDVYALHRGLEQMCKRDAKLARIAYRMEYTLNDIRSKKNFHRSVVGMGSLADADILRLRKIAELEADFRRDDRKLVRRMEKVMLAGSEPVPSDSSSSSPSSSSSSSKSESYEE